MGHWKVSVPVGSMSELELTLKHTQNIDLSGFKFYESLGMNTQGPPGKLIECLYPYRQYIHSMHMFNNYRTVGQDGRFLIEYDMEIMDALEIPCGVLHLRTPQSVIDIAGELMFLESHMERDITIAVENTPDSNNEGMGFDWIQVPDKIASHLTNSRLSQFGLCLDTSHALCRNELDWDTPAIQIQLKAIHLSESRIGHDDHESLEKHTEHHLIETVCKLMESSEQDGIVILEQSSHQLSLDSLQFLRENIGGNLDWLDYKLID